jgi:hypothetical protein
VAAEASSRFDLIRSAPWTLVLIIAVATADSFGSHDLWWHIPEGRMILATGHLPAIDTFSFTAFGQPWRHHEWLAQVLLALAWDRFGAIGLRLLKLVCAAILMTGLAAAMGAARVALRVQTIVLLFAAIAIEPLLELRPSMFSFAMMAVLIAVLAHENAERRAPLWPLVPLFILWANLHGGFVVGLAALAAYSGAATIGDVLQTRDWSRGLRLWLVTLAAALATLLNPQGPGLWRTILFVLRDPGARAAIVEWRPLIPSMILQWRTSFDAGVVYLMPVALFAAYGATALAAREQATLPLDAIAILLVGTAFDATRNMALGVIGLAVPLASHTDRLWKRRREASLGDAAAAREAPSPIPAPAAAVIALLILLSGGFFSTRLRSAYDAPVGAVAFMQAHDLHGNVLSDLTWGQYVSWHMGPRSRVFIDGRTHLVYPWPLLQEYLKFHFGLAAGYSLPDRYPVDFILIPPGAPPFRLVAANPRWRLIYRDQVAALFARSGSPAARAFPAPVIGHSPPAYFP